MAHRNAGQRQFTGRESDGTGLYFYRAVPPENRPVPQKVYRRPVMRRQEPAERSRHICGTSLESSMLVAGLMVRGVSFSAQLTEWLGQVAVGGVHADRTWAVGVRGDSSNRKVTNAL